MGKNNTDQISSCEDSRIIVISGDIEESTVINIIEKINSINNEDRHLKSKYRNPIKLYINSYGGMVDPAWSIISAIESSQTPVYTYCNRYAFSAALYIFLAGHKRFITKHTILMYHEISNGFYGCLKDHEEDIGLSRKYQKELDDYLLSKCNIPKKKIEKIKEKKKCWYIDAKKAKKYNMFDEYIS